MRAVTLAKLAAVVAICATLLDLGGGEVSGKEEPDEDALEHEEAEARLIQGVSPSTCA